MIPIENFIAKVKNSGLKLTPQRMMIFKMIAGSHDHPTAETLFRKVRKLHSTISMNTVYQTLDILKSLGLVYQIDLDDKSARFEANTQPHHHIVCKSCGKIEDVYDERLTKLTAPERFRRNYKISNHSVIFYGICKSCQNK